MGYEMYNVTSTVGDAFEGLAIASGAFGSFGSLVSLAMYLLLALGLYTIAQRREIKHPWMAFIPVANLWILGSIADQYQYVQNGAVRNRRKTLIALSVVQVILGIILFISLMGFIVNLIIAVNTYAQYDAADVLPMMLEKLLLPMGVSLVFCIFSLVLAIFQWICYYDLFASCEPNNKTLYLVLGIIFSFLMPIFVFICRDKDLGMPPRRTQIPE